MHAHGAEVRAETRLHLRAHGIFQWFAVAFRQRLRLVRGRQDVGLLVCGRCVLAAHHGTCNVVGAG